METTYRVVIKGAKEGISVEQAVRQLAVLFKATEDQIRPLITTPGTAVKKGVDITTATQYLSAIEKAGAQAIIEPETELQIDLPSQASTGSSAAPDVIPEKIRKNLAKHEKHVKLTCLECGYEGLMGLVREDKKYRKPLVIMALLFLAFAGAANFIPALYSLGFMYGSLPVWIKFGIPLAIGVFMIKRTQIIQCPNCEKELAKR